MFYNKFILFLYMFRALLCSSSGGRIVLNSIWYHHTCVAVRCTGRPVTEWTYYNGRICELSRSVARIIQVVSTDYVLIIAYGERYPAYKLTLILLMCRIGWASNNASKWQVGFNPLNAELNPICHLLALLGAHPILHVSRIRVNLAFKGLIHQPTHELNKIKFTIRVNLPHVPAQGCHPH